jgi:hypothetical protein
VKLIDRTETVVSPTGRKTVTHQQTWDFQEEVARGAKWLDRTLGGDWHNDLELERLDLNSGHNCVLGQLAMSRFRDQISEFQRSGQEECDCGDPRCTGQVYTENAVYEYSDVTRMFAEIEDPKWFQHSAGNPSLYGFYVSEEGLRVMLEGYDEDDRERLSRESWEHLTWAWMDEIRQRRTIEKAARMCALHEAQEAADKLLDEVIEESREMQPA